MIHPLYVLQGIAIDMRGTMQVGEYEYIEKTTESEYIGYAKADLTFPSRIKAFPDSTTKTKRTHTHKKRKAPSVSTEENTHLKQCTF